MSEIVAKHYEKYPYPDLPFFARFRREDLPLLNYFFGFNACYGTAKKAQAVAKILVVGCGTFEPLAVALANPGAEITAVDLSEKSLKKLRRRLWWRGLSRRVKLVQGDLLALPTELGNFDYIIASGVIHHLASPEVGLKALAARLNPNGIFRFMFYSRHGREWVERIRDWRKLLGIATPQELERALRKLPANHPFRLSYALYSDTNSQSGIMDGFFHVQEQSYDALEMPALLASAGIQAKKFLRSAGAELEKFPASSIDDWQKLAVLDRWNALEENFVFFAVKAER